MTKKCAHWVQDGSGCSIAKASLYAECPWCEIERLQIDLSWHTNYQRESEKSHQRKDDELTQLRGNLSLAEEGLANYALEVGRLKAALRLLDNGFKYSAEVCNIARGALAQSSHESNQDGRQTPAPSGHAGLGTAGGASSLHQPPSEPGAAPLSNDPVVMQRVLDRHMRWRETALGFLCQVIDGRGTEDEWPALAEFVEASTGRLTAQRTAVKSGGGHSNLCACPACLQARGREAIDNAVKANEGQS
jgi:hypothetical protein